MLGGCEVFNQHWPLERQSIGYEPYITNDIFQGQYGGIMERLWFSSRRLAIYVDNKVPLWVQVGRNLEWLVLDKSSVSSVVLLLCNTQ